NTFTVNEGGRTDLDQTDSHGVAIGYTLTNAVGGARPYDNGKTLLGFIYPNNNDSTGPSFSDFHVGELRDGAFTVMAKITDSSGISSVRYPIWTNFNGQDDLIWYDGHNTDNNDYYWARVEFSEHNNERGIYTIHLYAYDNSGNCTQAAITYTFDSDGPEISEVIVYDVSSSGYSVKCKVVDKEMSVLRVQFPSWTKYNDQDDIIGEWWTNLAAKGTKNGDYWTYRVNSSAHNSETGIYYTHIYAYDTLGNLTMYKLSAINVHDHIWGNGIVTKKPTEKEEGILKYACSICNEERTEKIEKLKTTNNEQQTTQSEKTTTKENSSTASQEKESIKKQRITTAKIKTYKVKKLKKKKVTFSLKAKTTGNGKLKYAIYTCSPSKNTKYIKVSKNGKVTIKKGAKKGTYRIIIMAKETSRYMYASKIVKIKIK
nr:GBS Bsp-like repeat-containing protein [Lachnospiraceae bacterium]